MERRSRKPHTDSDQEEQVDVVKTESEEEPDQVDDSDGEEVPPPPTVSEVLLTSAKNIVEVARWRINIEDHQYAYDLLQKGIRKYPTGQKIWLQFMSFCREFCIFHDPVYDANQERALNIYRKSLKKNEIPWGMHVFHSLFLPFTATELRLINEMGVKLVKPKIGCRPSVAKMQPSSSQSYNRRLKIGYYSSGLRDHTTTHLIQGVLREHDKTKFHVTCMNTVKGEDDDMFVANARCYCSEYLDVDKDLTPKKAAEFLASHKLDILIDLVGPTYTSMYASLFYKPAPIIVEWLGYPSGSGHSHIDYIITDERVSPWPDSKEWFLEKSAFLGNSYFIGDHAFMFPHLKQHEFVTTQNNVKIHLSSKEIIPAVLKTRASVQQIWTMIEKGESETRVSGHEVYNGKNLDIAMPRVSKGVDELDGVVATCRFHYNLDEDSIVLANLNMLNKITKSFFMTCIEILQAVDKSILWLPANPQFSIDQMRADLEGCGIDPTKLYCSNYKLSKEEHVRRGLVVDLFLDPWICNGHTTSLDALWSGTPLLTLTGDTFHSRVSTSLLHVLQLPVLITCTPEEYKNRAIFLAKNPAALKILRQLIMTRKSQSPLFDVKQFVCNIEDLYRRMWKRYTEGEEPEHILPEEGHDDWLSLTEYMDLEKLEQLCYVVDEGLSTVLRGGSMRMAEGNKRLVSERTPSPPDAMPGASGITRAEIKRPRTLQIFDRIRGEPNVIDTPTPSQESITPVTAIVGGFGRSLVGLGGAVQTEKFPSQPGHAFERMSILFSPTIPHPLPSCGPQEVYYIGQRGVNLIALENGVTRVLESMFIPRNISETCMGAIQANQFIQRLQEYFDDGLPHMPSSYSKCPNFFRSPQGLLCKSEKQLSWLLRFWKQATGELKEPTLMHDDINGLKWDTARRGTKMICYLCPPPYPTGNQRLTANTINTSHFIGNHSGQWYEGEEVKCPVCLKDQTRFSEDVKRYHTTHHKPTPACNENYYLDNEAWTESPEFKIDLSESFQQAATRYINEAGGKARKFTKIQKLATYTLWLAPACHLIISHLKANPSLISGTSMIGYQFKALLQCHLRTTPCPIIRDITKMAPNDRKNYATKIFKFHKKEHFFMMLRGLPTKDEMDETNWQTTENSIERVNDAQCKVCGDQRPSSVTSNRFGNIWKKDHLYPASEDEHEFCRVCGYYFGEQEDENAFEIHHEQHEQLDDFEETMIEFVNGAPSPKTHTIFLKDIPQIGQ